MRTSVTCVALENFQIQVRTQTHSWVADAPPHIGGDGLGPSPFELLLASLGTCTLITVYRYAAQAKLPLEKMTVDAVGDWAGEGDDERYAIQLTLRVRGKLDDGGLRRIKNAATRCPVHGVLAPGAPIETQVVLV